MQPAATPRSPSAPRGASSSASAEPTTAGETGARAAAASAGRESWSLASASYQVPKTDPALSQETKCLFPRYVYRAVSINDQNSPDGILYVPEEALMRHSRDALRKLAVEAVAHGNRIFSPFLHFTADLNAAYRLLRERSPRYVGQIIRVDTEKLDGKAFIDLSTPKAQRKWLSEEHNENKKLEVTADDLSTARNYALKDRELLFIAKVPDSCIVFVDHITGKVLDPQPQDPF